MTRPLILFAVLLIAVAGASCGATERPSPGPVQVAVAAATSAAAVTSTAAPPPAPPKSPFVEVPNLYAGDFDVLQADASGRVILGAERDVTEFDGSRLRQKVTLAENWLDNDWQDLLPNEVTTGYRVGPGGDVFLITSQETQREPYAIGNGYVYRLVSRAWVHDTNLGYPWRGIKLATWSKARWLVLAWHATQPQAKFFSSGSQADLPKLATSTLYPDATAVVPVDFAALATGELIVVGGLRGQGDGGVYPRARQGVLERFSPGSSTGVLETLTYNGINLVPRRVRMRSPTETWIGGDLDTPSGGGFVGRWNGKSWRFVTVDEAISDFDVEPDGTIWATTGARVMRGTLKHGLKEVPLPPLESGILQRTGGITVVGPGGAWRRLGGPRFRQSQAVPHQAHAAF